jgi:hypothetical protein
MHHVCKDHYQDYKRYKDEPWFIELVRSERRQLLISTKECGSVENFPMHHFPTPRKSVKDRVIETYLNNPKLSYRLIAEHVGTTRANVKDVMHTFKKKRKQELADQNKEVTPH